eukprot:TRINITY_DN4672_c0_g2_i1.p1 TRINITY_DN4672_c0_g2~~TRINITY_DN4672_c0_g2_i1.p1  ORF type:complete len:886 (-),score=227.41 TRINITY_DN4672_c0_g2_i1:1172-3829(-)
MLKWTLHDCANSPLARHGHAAASIGKQLFVYGGFRDGKCVEDLHVLDLNSWRWTPLTAAGQSPGPCAYAASVVIGKVIYLFGGRYSSPRRTTDVHALDTQSLTWTRLKVSGTAPSAREFHCAVFLQGEIAIYGGWDGAKWLSDMYVFNAERREWRTASSRVQPPPRSGHCAAVLGSTAVVIGGGGGGHGAYLNDVWLLSQAYEWRRAVADGVTFASRSGHACVGVPWLGKHTLAVMGGHGIESKLFGLSGREVYFADVLLLDVGASTWRHADTQGSIAPSARAYHSWTMCDGVAVLFGGWNGQQTFSDVWTLDAASPTAMAGPMVAAQPHRLSVPTITASPHASEDTRAQVQMDELYAQAEQWRERYLQMEEANNQSKQEAALLRQELNAIQATRPPPQQPQYQQPVFGGLLSPPLLLSEEAVMQPTLIDGQAPAAVAVSEEPALRSRVAELELQVLSLQTALDEHQQLAILQTEQLTQTQHLAQSQAQQIESLTAAAATAVAAQQQLQQQLQAQSSAVTEPVQATQSVDDDEQTKQHQAVVELLHATQGELHGTEVELQTTRDEVIRLQQLHRGAMQEIAALKQSLAKAQEALQVASRQQQQTQKQLEETLEEAQKQIQEAQDEAQAANIQLQEMLQHQEMARPPPSTKPVSAPPTMDPASTGRAQTPPPLPPRTVTPPPPPSQTPPPARSQTPPRSVTPLSQPRSQTRSPSPVSASAAANVSLIPDLLGEFTSPAAFTSVPMVSTNWLQTASTPEPAQMAPSVLLQPSVHDPSHRCVCPEQKHQGGLFVCSVTRTNAIAADLYSTSVHDMRASDASWLFFSYVTLCRTRVQQHGDCEACQRVYRYMDFDEAVLRTCDLEWVRVACIALSQATDGCVMLPTSSM